MAVAENVSDELKARYLNADAPAWIWDPDFKRIVWGNVRAAAFWGEASSATLPDRWFDPDGETSNALRALIDSAAGDVSARVNIPLSCHIKAPQPALPAR